MNDGRGPIDTAWMLGMIFQGKLGKAIDCLMKTQWPARTILDKLEDMAEKQWVEKAKTSLWQYHITPKGEDELWRLMPQARDAIRAVRDSREFGKVRNGR